MPTSTAERTERTEDTGAAPGSIAADLEARGIPRRTFLKFCATVTAALALPMSYTRHIAHALEQEATARPSLVWLHLQSCTGNTMALVRARDPSLSELILDLLSVDYQKVLMAAAGEQALAAKDAAVAEGGHLLVVEGSVPLDEPTCTIGGKSARQVLEEAAEGAAAIINVGTCSAYGGLPMASPNPTHAVGVPSIVSGVPIIDLPGCPANPVNMVATVVHFLTFGSLPATDRLRRPLFAYGERIHDSCERRAYFDAGQFAQEWGDEGHRKGWCLYRLGCKGPSTFHNCPVARYNDGTSWPVAAGHGCVGCSEPAFWDTMSPFYRRLPDVPGFPTDVTATQIGLGVVGLTAAGFAAHGVVKAVQQRAGPGNGDGDAEPVRAPADDETAADAESTARSDDTEGGEG